MIRKICLILLILPFFLGVTPVSEKEQILANYFIHFEVLIKTEEWDKILVEGNAAMEIAHELGRRADEAKICAQLTSTNYYRGAFQAAYQFAERCYALSHNLEDPSLLVRALYLKSAVCRIFAQLDSNRADFWYHQAVEEATEAASLYAKNRIDKPGLRGKVYMNLGAAHGDNPKGDLNRAEECYLIGINFFQQAKAEEDIMRIKIRLGKIYILQKRYDLAQKLIDEVRPTIPTSRIAMHTDYLEAQLKLEQKKYREAEIIATRALENSKKLKAKEDKKRIKILLKSILNHP